MKAILGTLAISAVLPIAVSAQVATGGAAAGSSVGGSSAAAAARSSGVAGSGAVSPTGVLAGQTPTAPGAIAPAIPSTAAPVGTPRTAVPAGPINPGGITGVPPQTAGRTFDRSTISGPPSEAIIDPGGNQPTFRFPPASSLPTPTLPDGRISATSETGAGGFPASPFPSGPVGVNNTVGTNFARGLTNAAPREPVAVNLPPGARVVTNVAGVPEIVVPPPAVVGTNIGGAPGVQTGTNRSVVPRTVPQVPRVSRGPILDSRTQ